VISVLSISLVLAAGPGGAPAAAPSPPIEQGNLAAHVEYLASDDLEGRGCGSEGLEAAARYVEERLRDYGVRPAGDGDTYRVSWPARCGEDGRETTAVNLVGVIPGSRAEWADQSVVVVAHYDHLGLGWPDVHEGDEGKIHNGADDNASGVAVLLEVARILADGEPPARSIVFLVPSGEEMGLRGSRHYVESVTAYPVGGIIAAINLDTVGRLGDGELLVLGAGSAREWPHLFRGISHTSGVPTSPVGDDPGGSDQKSFLDAGIPAVQLFTGPHLDYHRPGDDVAKLDLPGMVSVARVTYEAVKYLAGRDGPLNPTLAVRGGEGPAATASRPSDDEPKPRRASLGGVPDFAYEGDGYRLSAVTPGSGAEAAGLMAGDVVVEIAGEAIAGLRDVSRVLGEHRPGDRVPVLYLRDGELHRVELVLGAR
jgi:hypothetical protein